MDKERITRLLPHYVAMIVITIVVLEVTRFVLGGTNIVITLVVIMVIAVGYPRIVRALGLDPGW